MAIHLHIKGNIKIDFFIDDLSCQIHPFEDLFRALGKRPLLRRKAKASVNAVLLKPKL